MDLERFKYAFNLATTNTATSGQEICSILNDGCKKPIDFENSTSFYDLITIFAQNYQSYLNNIDILKTLLKQFGQEIEFGYYRKPILEDKSSCLVFGVTNPLPHIFDEDWCAIYAYDLNPGYQVLASNNLPLFNKKRKTVEITSLSKENIKNILEIAKNHSLLLESFAELKNKFLFGDGTTVIFTKIVGEIFDKLDTFTLTFGNAYFNTTDFIEINFELTPSLKILYEESKVILHDLEITDNLEKQQIINELLNSLYVNNKYLPSLYHLPKEESKVLRKKDNK